MASPVLTLSVGPLDVHLFLWAVNPSILNWGGSTIYHRIMVEATDELREEKPTAGWVDNSGALHDTVEIHVIFTS